MRNERRCYFVYAIFLRINNLGIKFADGEQGEEVRKFVKMKALNEGKDRSKDTFYNNV